MWEMCNISSELCNSYSLSAGIFDTAIHAETWIQRFIKLKIKICYAGHFFFWS